MGKWINLDDLPSGRVEWDDILDAPSIDIVRCKECKWTKAYGTYQWCGRLDSTARITADDFCSYGEREGE